MTLSLLNINPKYEICLPFFPQSGHSPGLSPAIKGGGPTILCSSFNSEYIIVWFWIASFVHTFLSMFEDLLDNIKLYTYTCKDAIQC